VQAPIATSRVSPSDGPAFARQAHGGRQGFRGPASPRPFDDGPRDRQSHAVRSGGVPGASAGFHGAGARDPRSSRRGAPASGSHGRGRPPAERSSPGPIGPDGSAHARARLHGRTLGREAGHIARRTPRSAAGSGSPPAGEVAGALAALGSPAARLTDRKRPDSRRTTLRTRVGLSLHRLTRSTIHVTRSAARCGDSPSDSRPDPRQVPSTARQAMQRHLAQWTVHMHTRLCTVGISSNRKTSGRLERRAARPSCTLNCAARSTRGVGHLSQTRDRAEVSRKSTYWHRPCTRGSAWSSRTVMGRSRC